MAGSRAAAHPVAKSGAFAGAGGCNASKPSASSRPSTSDRHDSAGVCTDATGTSASFDAVAAATSSGGSHGNCGSAGQRRAAAAALLAGGGAA